MGRLQYAAGHDSLTGLINGPLVLERLEQSMRNAQRYKNKIVVLYIEVDYFKQLNNFNGFDISNELLESVAQSLVDNTNENDTVARVEANEFVILLDYVDSIKDVQDLINKIMKLSDTVVNVRHHQIQTNFKVGVSIYPNDNVDAYILLSHAYSAMNMIKNSTTEHYKFYTPELAEEAFMNDKLEHELVESIKNNELEVVYEVLLDKTQTYVRWKHPSMGLLDEDQFLGLSKEIGFIRNIDIWVLQIIVDDFLQWDKDEAKPTKLCINISSLSLENQDFIDALKSIVVKEASLKDVLCICVEEVEIQNLNTILEC
ncbi:MAG: diguanylate cyclase [Sulfurimonas sp.]|nr:diguanylate cyclase [Sulfurimonas sp.]